MQQVGASFKFDNFRPNLSLWHYGEHSNHLPRVSCWAGDRWVLAGDQDLYWISPGNAPSV